MEMLRRQFGIAEPVRRGMELKIAREGEWRPAALGGASGVHRDILEGRDAEVGWEDVFVGKSSMLDSVMLGRDTTLDLELGCKLDELTILCRQRTPRGS